MRMTYWPPNGPRPTVASWSEAVPPSPGEQWTHQEIETRHGCTHCASPVRLINMVWTGGLPGVSYLLIEVLCTRCRVRETFTAARVGQRRSTICRNA